MILVRNYLYNFTNIMSVSKSKWLIVVKDRCSFGACQKTIPYGFIDFFEVMFTFILVLTVRQYNI